MTAENVFLRVPGAQLELTAYHSGLPLAVALVQLVWYAALRRGRAAPGAARLRLSA